MFPTVILSNRDSFLVHLMYLVLFSFTISPNCNEIFFNFLKVSIIVCLVRAVINISSAYSEHCFKRVEMLPLSSSCFKIASMTS